MKQSFHLMPNSAFFALLHIYCAFGPTLAASAKLMCISTHTSKRHADQPHSFFKNGEMAVTLPTAALYPPFRALGRSLHAKLLQLADSTFPTGPHLLFFSSFGSITVSRDKMSEGLLRLGTLSIHTGMSKSPYHFVTAIISSSWMTVFCLLAITSSSVLLSTSVLKKRHYLLGHVDYQTAQTTVV